MFTSAPMKVRKPRKKTQENQGSKIFIRIHNKKWDHDITSAEEQLDYIREVIEDECGLDKLGLKFVGFLTYGKTRNPIVCAEYIMKKTVDFDAIRKVFEEQNINQRFQIYIILNLS